MIHQEVSRRKFLTRTGAIVAGSLAVGVLGSWAWLTRPWELESFPREGKEPIKIGDLGGKTGVYYNWGRYQTMALKLAAKEINEQGGVLGRPIQVVTEDTELKPPVGTVKAEKLVLEDKVKAIFGAISSSVTLAVMDVTGRYKTLHFNGISCADEMRSTKFHKYYFGCLHDTRMNAFGLVPYLVAEDMPNISKLDPWKRALWVKPYVFYVDYSMGQADERGFRMVYELEMKRQGKPVTYAGRSAAPLGTTDFTPWFPAIRSAKPDSLYFAFAGLDSIRGMTQLYQQGLWPKEIDIAGIACALLEDDIPAYGSSVKRFTHVTYWASQIDTPENKKFVDAFFKEYGTIPNIAAWPLYDAVKAWAWAVEKAGTFDSDAVVKALEGAIINTAVGKVYIRPEDHQWIYDGAIGVVDDDLKYKLVTTYDGWQAAGAPRPGYNKPIDELYKEPWDPEKYKQEHGL
ncbi:MAG: ABC transporter substrate-binding protein [Candidatus Caldarchaeum sp.]